ncbi:hypothetical protein BOTBODRAFT_193005 [Botryobasidium botryosum FD-172 SS1]|uniref:CFEM domain-containing protein n=1 Tax=Botryobasidium botryosum (strain FD-172 SS1) TaxID=930990 RepID=A0A067M4K3_BOTB1|nr:hypothetical protein BOTBODRAFT_193005 [Botryobasidium botryosum FD-172 SS1]
MRFSAGLLSLALAFSATASLTERAGYPTCVQPCLASLNLTSTGCNGSSDIGCLCTKPQFITAANTCITSSCPNPDDQNQARAFAQQLCRAVGVDVNTVVPSLATATAGSAPSCVYFPTHCTMLPSLTATLHVGPHPLTTAHHRSPAPVHWALQHS